MTKRSEEKRAKTPGDGETGRKPAGPSQGAASSGRPARGRGTAAGSFLPVFAGFFLFAATVLLFLPVAGHEFISLDDGLYVTGNPVVQGGLTPDGFLWAFRTFHASNWHPLTWLSHMADAELFGLAACSHHMVNVVFHAANAVLLFWVLGRMTGALWRSLLAALLFAVHPLHVESVAWISERKDVLSTFFGLLAILQYARYVERRSAARYAVVAACFALGLMAKPMLVTLPFVLLLLDYWPLNRFPAGGTGTAAPGGFLEPLSRLLLEKAPLFLLAAASCVVTYLAQQRGGSVGPQELYPLPLRAANALVSYGIYLRQTIWPARLAVIYPYAHGSFPAWKAAGAGILLAAVTAGTVRFGRRLPHLPVGWLWFLGTLVPVIGLVQVGNQLHADRYMYLPSIGLFLAFAWSLPDPAPGRIPWSRIGAAAAGAWVLGLAAVASADLGYWRDSETLYRRAMDVTEGNWLARKYLGIAVYNRGAALGNSGRPDEAVARFEEALRVYPEYELAHYSLGVTLGRMGRTEEGVEHFRKAIRIDPAFYEAHFQLGVALGALGRPDEASAHFREALKFGPRDPAFRDQVERALSQALPGRSPGRDGPGGRRPAAR